MGPTVGLRRHPKVDPEENNSGVHGPWTTDLKSFGGADRCPGCHVFRATSRSEVLLGPSTCCVTTRLLHQGIACLPCRAASMHDMGAYDPQVKPMSETDDSSVLAGTHHLIMGPIIQDDRQDFAGTRRGGREDSSQGKTSYPYIEICVLNGNRSFKSPSCTLIACLGAIEVRLANDQGD
jgi:hypothetical protein